MTYINIAPHIQEALQAKEPIVALESTIISHGMPYPQNIETALQGEQMVRGYGAIPATIAIINGQFKVGLTTEEIDYLGKSGKNIVKASRRDLPYLFSQKIDGATTVASTMIAARLAGIKIFATGGIGGVHRGASTSFDVSADLQELAQTEVAVVCAGIKSILDLGLTLEYLETHGVPVIGYRTKELPAFYTQTSGFEVDYQLDTAEDIAQLLHAKWSIPLKGGVVVANPIFEEDQLEPDFINGIIAEAIKEAEKLGIKGKENTPFLLSKVKELTAGESLKSNIQLYYNNACLAAEVAVALMKI